MSQGIYTSYTVGDGEQTVKFILVDNRYNRDTYDTEGGDLLGAAQWAWLENELMTSTAAFNVIVSGIQVLANDRFNLAEGWSRFPNQRERLLQLILASRAKGVILLSGDVHFSEINQVVCSGGENVITEITSSGMTHSWVRSLVCWLTRLAHSRWFWWEMEQNSHALSLSLSLGLFQMQFHRPEIKFFPALLFTFANLLLPWEFRPTHDALYSYINWGQIEFDWTRKPFPVASVQVRGRDNAVKLRYEFASKPVHSASPAEEAAACRPTREMATWKRVLGQLAFAGVVGFFLLSLLVNGVVALWLAWFFTSTLVALVGRSGKKLLSGDKHAKLE